MFGARPLKRAVQRMVQNPLALAVLEGRFVEGDHIVADVDASGTLQFSTAAKAEVPSAEADAAVT